MANNYKKEDKTLSIAMTILINCNEYNSKPYNMQ